VILTGGVAGDVGEMREELVGLAEEPVSVVMIGVGKDELDGMEEFNDIVKDKHGKPSIREMCRYEKYGREEVVQRVLRDVPG